MTCNEASFHLIEKVPTTDDGDETAFFEQYGIRRGKHLLPILMESYCIRERNEETEGRIRSKKNY